MPSWLQWLINLFKSKPKRPLNVSVVGTTAQATTKISPGTVSISAYLTDNPAVLTINTPSGTVETTTTTHFGRGGFGTGSFGK